MDCGFTTGFPGPKSFQDFRETGPWAINNLNKAWRDTSLSPIQVSFALINWQLRGHWNWLHENTYHFAEGHSFSFFSKVVRKKPSTRYVKSISASRPRDTFPVMNSGLTLNWPSAQTGWVGAALLMCSLPSFRFRQSETLRDFSWMGRGVPNE